MAESLIEARAAAETEPDCGTPASTNGRRSGWRLHISGALWFKPHLCVVEREPLYACASGARDGMRGSPSAW